MARNLINRTLVSVGATLVLGAFAAPAAASCGSYVQVPWRLTIGISLFELPPLWAIEDLRRDRAGVQTMPSPCASGECGEAPEVPDVPLPAGTSASSDRPAFVGSGGSVVGEGRYWGMVPLDLVWFPEGALSSLWRPPCRAARLSNGASVVGVWREEHLAGGFAS